MPGGHDEKPGSAKDRASVDSDTLLKMDAMSQPPRFGLTTLTCIVIASMIGTGVFTTSGFTLATLGTPQRVMMAWLIGGIVAVCGAIAYGELAKRLPVSGGEYLYLSRRLHPFFGFLAGWVSLTAGFSGAIAVSALAFEKYALSASRPDWLPEKVLALGLILLFGFGHGFLVRPFAVIQNAVVGIKLVALLVFLGVAAAKIGTHPWHWEPVPEFQPLSAGALVMAFASSVMWISLSFAGFNAAIYISSEVREPERNVPRSLWLGTVIVTVLYLLLNAVFVSAAPASELVLKEEVAAVAAGALGGSSLETLIRIAVCLGTTTSVAGMIMTGPRVFSRMADDGLFPAWFGSGAHGVTRTVLLQTAIAGAMVYMGTIQSLVKYLATILTLSSTLTVATLFLPPKGNGTDRSMSIVTAMASAFFVIVSTFTAILMVQRDPNDLKATMWTLVVGAVLWGMTRVMAPRGGAPGSAPPASSSN